MKPFALINGTIVTHEKSFQGTLIVKNGKIAEVRAGTPSRLRIPTIDVGGKHILPGLIDAHVHFRTPGMTKKEDWVSGSKAALAGGVTTVLDMPNTKPPTIDAASLKSKRSMVKSKTLVNYGFYVGATPKNLKDLKKLKNIAGVKIYMGSSTGNLLVENKENLEQFFAESKHLLAIHAESEACIQMGVRKYHGVQGINVHSLIRASECAEMAVKEVMHLAKKYGTRVHICHVSTQSELDIIQKFKDDKISVEVTPHHLFLTDKDYRTFGNLIKVNPPVRGLFDQVALWEGLKTGLIDMVATDHAPHLLEEKKLPYNQVPSGIPGVQTMLPLLLNAVNDNKLSLEKVVELTSYNPARLYGIKNKGVLQKGADADLTVVDMKLEDKVIRDYLWSKASWSPFSGMALRGWPVMTFVAGERMYQWRETFGKKKGKEVEFKR